MSSSSVERQAEAAPDADGVGGDARQRDRRSAGAALGENLQQDVTNLTLGRQALPARAGTQALVRDRECLRTGCGLVGDPGLAADRGGGEPLGDAAERGVGRGGRRQRADLDRAEEGVEAAVEAIRAGAARLRGAAQRLADPARELGVGARQQEVVEAVAGVQREQLEAGGGAVEALEVGEEGRACVQTRLHVELAVAGDVDAQAKGIGGAAQGLAQGLLHIRVIGSPAEVSVPPGRNRSPVGSF